MPRKVAKLGSAARGVLDLKNYGKETVFDGTEEVISESALRDLLNWYNYIEDRNSSNKFLMEFLKNKNLKTYQKAKAVPKGYFSKTSGWLARIITLGGKINSFASMFLEEDIKFAIKKWEQSPKVEVVKVDKNPFKAIEKKNDAVANIEELIDLGKPFDIYDELTKENVPLSYKDNFVNYYDRVYKEVKDAYDKKDKDLVEAYSHLKRKELKSLVELYKNITDGLDRYFVNRKITRKTRVKKPVSPDKKLKHLEFASGDPSLKIVSIDKSEVLKSLVLYVYNKKYSSLTRIVAGDEGFDVRGKTIYGIKESETVTKSIKRKTSEVISKMLTGTKASKRKYFDSIKSKPIKFTGRINNNMILLSVHK